MGFKVITVFKYILGASFCLLVSQLCFADTAPVELDFIGGGYVDGEYRCYSEPCFSLHKGKVQLQQMLDPLKLENGFQGEVMSGHVKMPILICLRKRVFQR
jgi:hypothetical protein